MGNFQFKQNDCHFIRSSNIYYVVYDFCGAVIMEICDF